MPAQNQITSQTNLSEEPLSGEPLAVKPLAVPPQQPVEVKADPGVGSAVSSVTNTDDSAVVQSAVQSTAAAPSSEQATVTLADSPTLPDDVSPSTTSSNNNIVADDILDILRFDNQLNDEQISQIIAEQATTGKSIEEILTEKNLVNEETLIRSKAKLDNIPFVKISDTGISPQALAILDEGVAKRYHALPFAVNGERQELLVAMLDPMDLTAVNFIKQKTGYKILTHYAMPSELNSMIAERYAQNISQEVTRAVSETSQVAEQKIKQADLSALAGGYIRDAPINRIVDTLVEFAMNAQASDIHIEPLLERTRVRYRIDGILQEKIVLPKSVHEAVISRIKILCDLKIDEKRIPQDGRFNFASQGQDVDLRVSTLPTVHGEKVVMRLLKKEGQVPTLEELGMSGVGLTNMKQSIRVPHGIILVTGPTGSGKTTTLYSVLHLINSSKVNIMTLEDPVEYQMAGINQVQVNVPAGLTFANGLRSFLRQDPNIIMVGEIRDNETANLAIQASLTGHLVFSTLHTSSAAGALPRMIDMEAEPFLLASTITLVMAQRVVRQLNNKYKEEYLAEPAVLEDVKKVLGIHYDSWCRQHQKDPNKLVLYRPKKNLPANETEYRGRIGIFEVMMITDEMSKLILERRPANELEKVALKNGMLLMKQDGYLKALEGITTIEEILRVAEV